MIIKKAKLAFLALTLLVLSVAGTNAFYSDEETSTGNAFSAGTLMTDLRSGQSNFASNPLDMEPGDSVSRDVYVQKNGSLDMNYKTTVEVLPGSDPELCEALELNVWHNWYSGLPLPGHLSNRIMSLKYDGYLDDLDVTNALDGSPPYFFNIFFAPNEHWYYFNAKLPASAPYSLRDKTCNFNVKVSAWQIGGSEGNGFHDVATLESTIGTGDWKPDNFVVVNEFIPDPVGSDDAAMPDGEWVELYNNGSFSFDLAGWALYDADDTHELIISTSNSDNNGNPTDTGETTIAAGGRLVVYRNGDADFELDNTGDTIRLFNDQISTGGTLVDGYSFAGGFAEGKSFARSPEGTGSFVDPIPTPGRANVFNLGDLSADAKAWRSGTNYLHVGIFDGLNYDQAQINVIYQRDEAGQPVTDGFSKQVSIDRNNLYVMKMFFGTESGEVLYPHLNVQHVQVEVVLSGSGMPDRRIEINL